MGSDILLSYRPYGLKRGIKRDRNEDMNWAEMARIDLGDENRAHRRKKHKPDKTAANELVGVCSFGT